MLIKIIHMDLYRMIKSLSTWIIILVSGLVYCLMLFVSTSSFGDDISLLNQISKVIFGDFIAMFLAIFVSIFWYADYKNGYIKNTWNSVINKVHFIFSKTICALVFIVLEYIFLLFVSGIFNLVYLHNKVIGDWSSFIKCLMCQLILNVAFGTIIILVNCLVKNHAIAIASCIAYVTIAPVTVYSAINILIGKVVSDKNFSIGEYLPYGNLYNIVPDSSTSDYTKAYIISLGFILISFICTSLVLRRREIK